MQSLGIGTLFLVRRILLLITDLEIGGTPTVVRELAMRLHRQPGIEIHVACLASWGPVADQLRQAGVQVTALDARSITDLGVVSRLSKLIAQHSLDTVFSFLIHANTIAAASSLTHRGVRYIQSIQTTQPRPRWHWWLQGVIHVAADTIVVPSPSVAQVAEQWAGIPRSKIVVIPNAVEMGEYQRGCPSRQVDPPVPIGFIGRLDPIKRLPDLLDAVKLLAGKVHLHIFGDGRERPIIESRIQALAITPWVTLHGSIPNPHQALSQIDLLVLPSEAEGFGLVLIEAMAARIPVIATNVPGIRDVVQDRQTGLLVPVAQPQAFADAIAKLTADAPLRSTLVAQAFQDVNNRFSWDAVLPQYLRLLQL
ncbi:MAG TPA: glycosyltransferase family 4 protein [Tepidisphaeraceae bacterium]|nr:glycosyltransferase family 4 protein [Tepidisphaeraceae bacterium]